MSKFYPTIAIFGRKGAGKTTFSGYLREALKMEQEYYETPRSVEYTLATAVPYSFALPIKRIVQQVFGIPLEKIDVLKNDPKGFIENVPIPMRQILQTIGQNFRELSPSVWVDKAIRLALTHSIVIDDGRYLNEFDSIQSINGFCIVMTRKEDNQLSQAESTHASETGVDEILKCRTLSPYYGGFRYDNNGTHNDMKKVIREIVVPGIYAHFHKVNDAKQ